MRGLVHGMILALAIWTGVGSLVMMFVYHGGRPLQVTLANSGTHVGD